MLKTKHITGGLNPAMSRRALLAGIGTATASAALAVPAIQAAPVLTARERLDAAIAEFKAAYEAEHGEVERWVMWGDIATPIMVPVAIKWSGDGRYEIERGHTRPVLWITRAPEHDDADRWFKVSTGYTGKLQPPPFFCRESALPTITRRVA